MKLAFLPHYFKKIGVVCFFVMLVFIIVVSIMTTWQALSQMQDNPDEVFSTAYRTGYSLGQQLATTKHWIVQIASILLLLGVAFYMLAKEKVDDEYIDSIRWNSLRIALIISIGVTILTILLKIDLSAKNILLLLFITYLPIFKIKKSRFYIV